jgi:hypothetical protein
MNTCNFLSGRLGRFAGAFVLAPILVARVLAAESSTERSYTFDEDATGKPPAGFVEALTAGGGPVKWNVIAVSDAPSGQQVVAQLSQDNTNTRYPLLVLDDFSAKDVDVSVKF